MKRRNFIGGLFASSILFGTTLKASGPKPIVSSEEEQFYTFFQKFNGFPIHDYQKTMFEWYKKDYKLMTMGRRTGVSVFMLTIAAWEACIHNKNVVHFSSNQHLSELVKRQFREKIGNRPHATVDFVSIQRDAYPLRAIRYHVGLYDVSGAMEYTKWCHMVPLFEKNFSLQTGEYLPWEIEDIEYNRKKI
jgi:hypothetical protein